MASNPNITDLTANLQEYVSDNPAIFGKHFVPLNDMFDFMSIYPNIEDKQPLLELAVSDPNQPGNRASFAPKENVLNWKNRTLVVKNAEITLQFKQSEIESMWRSYLAKIAQEQSRGNVYDFPFESYMMQKVIEKSKDQIRRLSVWKGALNATGTTSADIMDGYLTKIAADITGGAIPAGNVFTGAAITASNAEAQFNGVRDLLITQYPEYMNMDLVCFAAPENVHYYSTNYQANHDSLPYNNEFKKTMLEGLSNCPIIPEIGLTGSDRIVLTPVGNLAYGNDAAERMSNIEIEKKDRTVTVLVDWKQGVEYAIAELLLTNSLT